MKDFVLESQLPDPAKALQRAKETLIDAGSLDSSESASQCSCPHLLHFLPEKLNLEMMEVSLPQPNTGVKTTRFMMKNPIHALHLATQLDNGTWTVPEESALLYGDEQERQMAWLIPGISDPWHPWLNPPASESPPIPPKPVSAEGTDPLASTAARGNEHQLSDSHYWILHTREDQIRHLQRQFFASRTAAKKVTTNKKRKLEQPPVRTILELAGWKTKAGATVPDAPLEDYRQQMAMANRRVEVWLNHYRRCREKYWSERKAPKKTEKASVPMVWGRIEGDSSSERHCFACQKCSEDATGETTLMCLECGFVGCFAGSNESHAWRHFARTNHAYAVTCDAAARIFCFQCNEFVQHPVFDHELARIDISNMFPLLSWPENAIQRSFDAINFMQLPEHGIIWAGMKATYPAVVPAYHVEAANMCRQRKLIFNGDLESLDSSYRPDQLQFAESQSKKDLRDRFLLCAPVGMYNLGQTCFQSAVLQCLIHYWPFQKHFLFDVRHNFRACEHYRASAPVTAAAKKLKSDPACLGCEMDKIFVRYYGSTTGVNALDVLLAKPSNPKELGMTEKGDPLVTTEMLSAAWQCGGMAHIAGYDQRDAHEFLHAFLDTLGKHTMAFQERVLHTSRRMQPRKIRSAEPEPAPTDFVRQLFEGTLRSVLICQECGNKRVQNERFLSISLPLAGNVLKMGDPEAGLSVERCLRHFTLPEILADSVQCPSCMKPTATKKQHVVSKLPRVLCLHLKRFDPAQNKKIEDFVSFPGKGLNMGPYLPHWCEVTRVPQPTDASATAPDVLYDLFGMVTHYGTLQSGHYVANVRVQDKWYHCNDSHVSHAEEDDVLQNKAYLLFYAKR